MAGVCRIYNFMAGVTGPIYDYNHCHTGDIAKSQVTHITNDVPVCVSHEPCISYVLLPIIGS